MRPDLWIRVERVFEQALDVPAAERESWLERACGDDLALRDEVRSLLAADAERSGKTLVGSLQQTLLSFGQHSVSRRIGPYELLEEIGRGGMGAVYKAQRVDQEYQSTVAIKLVRPELGADAVLKRFRRERQILARLSHPSVARLLDGGTTPEGIPYIVMEYIDGVSITDYCRTRNLSLRERLALFLPVCSAVDYAHRNFIVHRDIKPGNILIDAAGTPKLLDFGISKLLHADPLQSEPRVTESVALMTPQYASPEQIRGETITIRSDVYSLGAVLYEVLAGVKAHELRAETLVDSKDSASRSVAPPSSVAIDRRVARALAGDLDHILMRALQLEPQLRYESAAALASDIRRYLEDRPLHGRRGTPIYLARKFVKRHRALVGGATAAFFALGVGATIAVRQAQIAENREQQVRSLARVFLFDVHDSIRDLPGATKARQTIVETATRYLDALAESNPSQPELLRELAAGYARVGDIQGNDNTGANLGQLQNAGPTYRKAVALLDRLISVQPDDRQALIDRVTALRRLSDIEAATSGPKGVAGTLAATVDSARRLLDLYPDDWQVRELVGETLMIAGRRLREAGDLRVSLATTSDALRIVERLASESPDNRDIVGLVAATESAMGMTLGGLGNLEAAAAHYERAVAHGERLVQLEPSSVVRRRSLMIAYSHVGDTLGFPSLSNLDDAAGAERAYRRMVDLARELYEADSANLRGASDYGIALMRLGVAIPNERGIEKQSVLESASRLMDRVLQRSPDNLQIKYNAGFLRLQLGDVARNRGNTQEALLQYRRAIELSEPYIDSGYRTFPGTFVVAAGAIARIHAEAGRARDAHALLERALAVAQNEASRQPDDGVVGQRQLLPRVYSALAFVHARQGDSPAADAWRVKALTAWRELSTMPGFTTQMRREMEAAERER